MDRNALIGVALIAVTLSLDWLEIKWLKKWDIDKRFGVACMATAGALLLVGTPLGSAILSLLGKLRDLAAWVLRVIPLPDRTEKNGPLGMHWTHMTGGFASGIAAGLLMALCAWVVVRVFLGMLPRIVSTKGMTWRTVYMAAAVPLVIGGSFLFVQQTLGPPIGRVTNWMHSQTDKRVLPAPDQPVTPPSRIA